MNNESDNYFLEGPHSRRSELRFAFRVLAQFIRGFRALHFVGSCVTVFGSARFEETHAYYRLAREMGARLAQLGSTVMTGGGPGLMEPPTAVQRTPEAVPSVATLNYRWSRSLTLTWTATSSCGTSS